MPLKFYEANCVLVGTFNIYIIRPDWLVQTEIIQKNSEVRYEGRLDEPGFRMSFPKQMTRWNVLPNRLVVESNNVDEDCGSTVALVVDALPWTPVSAIGVNVSYRGKLSDVEDWSAKTSYPIRNAPEGSELVQRTWHVGVKREGHVFNLQASEKPDGIEVSANIHTELRERDIDFVKATARQFFTHRETAVRLIKDLLGIEVENGSNNR